MEYPSIPIGTTTTSYGITLVMTEDGWRADLQHTMMRRCRNWDYHKPWTYLMTLSCQHHEVVPMPQAASLPEGWQYPQWLRDAYAKPGRPHLFGELAGEREEDAHIVLFPQGIPSDMRNKAGFGPYFDACANGQLLILSPWEYGKPAAQSSNAGNASSSMTWQHSWPLALRYWVLPAPTRQKLHRDKQPHAALALNITQRVPAAPRYHITLQQQVQLI